MIIFVLIILLLLVIIVLFYITTEFVGFLMTRVPFVPTRTGDIEFIAKQLNISQKDFFFDLGSGNGKVIFNIEKQTGARVRGFELTLWTSLVSRIRKVLRRSHAQILNKNFFKQSWGEATIIYGYLYPPLMARVEEKFLAECKSGSTAIIRDFPFPKLQPTEIFKRPHKHELYVYKI